jgi:hypothetical protein
VKAYVVSFGLVEVVVDARGKREAVSRVRRELRERLGISVDRDEVAARRPTLDDLRRWLSLVDAGDEHAEALVRHVADLGRRG